MTPRRGDLRFSAHRTACWASSIASRMRANGSARSNDSADFGQVARRSGGGRRPTARHGQAVPAELEVADAARGWAASTEQPLAEAGRRRLRPQTSGGVVEPIPPGLRPRPAAPAPPAARPVRERPGPARDPCRPPAARSWPAPAACRRSARRRETASKRRPVEDLLRPVGLHRGRAMELQGTAGQIQQQDTRRTSPCCGWSRTVRNPNGSLRSCGVGSSHWRLITPAQFASVFPISRTAIPGPSRLRRTDC